MLRHVMLYRKQTTYAANISVSW